MAKRGRKRLLEGQEGRVCHFYYDTDMSVVAIARRFDVSAGVINRILEEHGKTCELPRPTGGFRRLKRTGLPASRSGACSGMRRSSGAALHRLRIGRFPPYHIFSPMENVFFVSIRILCSAGICRTTGGILLSKITVNIIQQIDWESQGRFIPALSGASFASHPLEDGVFSPKEIKSRTRKRRI